MEYSQSKSAAEELASQYSYLIPALKIPVTPSQLLLPGSIYVSAIVVKEKNQIYEDGYEDEELEEMNLNVMPDGYSAIVQFVEWDGEYDCEKQMLLDMFIHCYCYPRPYPLFMKKEQTISIWRRFFEGQIIYVSEEVEEIQILGIEPISTTELFLSYPELRYKYRLPAKDSYTVVVTYNYGNSENSPVRVDLLPELLNEWPSLADII